MKRQEYELLFAKQKGRCAICGETPTRLYVDRCPRRKLVRGLLCGSCISGLRMFNDDPFLLRTAAVLRSRDQKAKPRPSAMPGCNKRR
jgi:hypothetical protein